MALSSKKPFPEVMETGFGIMLSLARSDAEVVLHYKLIMTMAIIISTMVAFWFLFIAVKICVKIYKLFYLTLLNH